MTAIQLLACAGMIVGVFLLLGMKPVEFTDSLFGFLLNPKRSLREDIRESSGRKKSGILRRELEEAQNILQMTGRGNRFSIICAVALALFCAGGSIAILLGNFFLAPVMAVGFLFLPFWYVKLTANHYKRDVSAELETALSVITTAYLRTEDIVTAVEENIAYLNPPVSRVFQDFLIQIKMVNPDVQAALRILRGRIDNEVFREWCDAVSDCQHDRSLKTTLPPIVSKLKELSSRKRCQSIKPSLEKIKVYARGWLNYYGIASMKNNIDDINGWLYHRIRMCIWKQWKKPRTKYKNLVKLGIPEHYAATIANSRRKYWYISNNKAVIWALNKERLINSGYYDLARAYQSVHVNY